MPIDAQVQNIMVQLELNESSHSETHCEALEASLAQYRRFLEQQTAIFDEDLDLKCLETSLRKLPNISKVDVLDCSCESYDDDMNIVDSHPWYNEQSSRAFGCALEPFGSREKIPDSFGYKWDLRGLQNFIRATGIHCLNVRRFYFGSKNTHALLSALDFSTEEASKLCKFAERLTHLRLYCASSDWGLEQQAATYYRVSKHVGKWLPAADNLVHLDINGPFYLSIILDNPLPQLARLHLEFTELGSAENLISISLAHAKTLQELHLTELLLDGTDEWDDLGKQMGKHLRLHRVRINGLGSQASREKTSSPYMDHERSMDFLRNVMQWVAEDELQFEKEDCYLLAWVKTAL